MNEADIIQSLHDLPLGGLRFFDQTGSTNDVALAWAADGAPDLSLVCAEEQTAARGRGSHRWFSPSDSALSFSLIFHPLLKEKLFIQLFSGLGALGVCEALQSYGLDAQIKWPNDVLLRSAKVCGVLAEAIWMGDEIDTVVLGVGVNVTPPSVPLLDQLDYPATCIEAHTTTSVDRPKLLRDILVSLLLWRDQLTSSQFLIEWEKRLAFRGETVRVMQGNGYSVTGTLVGLEPDGSLRLFPEGGDPIIVTFGEAHLRLVV